jgi:hypothetical protein
VRELQTQVFPEYSSSGAYDCLDNCEWFNDDVMQLFIDCLLRGIPEPDSEASRSMEPPSMLRTGGILNEPQLDLSEVCILDPQNGKTILEAFETSNYVPCLKMTYRHCVKQVRELSVWDCVSSRPHSRSFFNCVMSSQSRLCARSGLSGN